jgi:hypothetical protein
LTKAPTGAVRKIVGGVISPLLANIYLNELNRFVEDMLVPAYTRGKRRQWNPDYVKLCSQIRKSRKQKDIKEVERLKRERRKLTAVAPVDPDYRRLRYIRYTDDFLLGFIGPKEEAKEIRQRLGEFLERTLKLTLSTEKTLITHAGDERAQFLGYEIKVTRQETLVSENGKRATNGAIRLLMPQKVVHKYRSLYSKSGKVIHRAELIADTDYTIVQRYQAVLKGLYNYYCMAINVGTRTRMGCIKWILQTSLTKTLARKFGCRVSGIYKRYQVVILARKMLRVIVQRPDKEPLTAVFGGFPLKRIPRGMGVTDFRHETAWHRPGKLTEVVQRLLAGKCELCGIKDVPIEVHHVRKLADINRPGRRPKATWEKVMSARRRKTLVVCQRCHDDITFGRYDGPSPRNDSLESRIR